MDVWLLTEEEESLGAGQTGVYLSKWLYRKTSAQGSGVGQSCRDVRNEARMGARQ